MDIRLVHLCETKESKPVKRKIIIGTSSVVLLTFLLGGIESLLLQDIPLLCFCIAVCVGVFFASWLGNRIVPRNAPQKWGRWFKRTFTKLALLCIVWSALFLSLYLFPPFFISAKTTYVTEPRLTDRYGVDYLVHFEREVSNEDNAARHIVAALGYGFFFDKKTWKHIHEKWDLPEEFEPTTHFANIFEFRRSLSEKSKTLLAKQEVSSFVDIRPPYSAEEQKIWQPYFEENELAFAMFEEALQKPAFYVPPQYVYWFILVPEEEAAKRNSKNAKTPEEDEEAGMKDLSDYFGSPFLTGYFYGRCLYQLSLGNMEEAWRSVRLLYRYLALYLPYTEMSMEDNYHVRLFANRAAETVLLYGNWNAEEIRRAYQEVSALQCPFTEADAHRILHGERLRYLDFKQSGAELQVHKPRYLPDCFLPIGQEMVAFNHCFDKQIKGNYGRESGYNKVFSKRKMFELIVWYGLRNGAGVFNGANDFGLANIINCIDYQQANSELTLLVFALELYRKEHGNLYPPDLESLCNGYIEKMPVDPFSQAGESITYKVNANHTGYLVYSVGKNGNYDGGRDSCDEPRGDDIRRKVNWEE